MMIDVTVSIRVTPQNIACGDALGGGSVDMHEYQKDVSATGMLPVIDEMVRRAVSRAAEATLPLIG